MQCFKLSNNILAQSPPGGKELKRYTLTKLLILGKLSNVRNLLQ